jgi:hypothetical protein
MSAFMNFNLLASVSDGGGATVFGLMTLTSVGFLWILPIVGRRHVSKFGTYTHEVSHGVISLLTGGEFHRFHVGDWGGMCVTSGGNRKAVTAAGYIGTIVVGAIFLARSAQADTLIVTLQILAVLLALSTLKAGDLQTATLGTAVAAFLGLFSSLFPGALPTRFLLNLMGVILVWQGLRALKTLWRISATATGTGSDAEAMARLTGRSAMHWAVVFGGIALVAFVVITGLALTTDARVP